ncbi:hypothetical protein K440DRAFT_615089 [Wilcoxina mikolae CBS 423.85]|nr:hypothetical protein K440DRAFT_615089 [Wilcoxina mikolae CBS 423.85]
MDTPPSTTCPHTALCRRDRALSTTSPAPAPTTTDLQPRARKRALSCSPPRNKPSRSAPPSIPARSVLKYPKPPPRLPVLTHLRRCCFQRVLHEGPLSVVVLASVAGEQRVIKIVCRPPILHSRDG